MVPIGAIIRYIVMGKSIVVINNIDTQTYI